MVEYTQAIVLEERYMSIKGKIFTHLYEVSMFLYKHPGRWYSREISERTGVSHPSVYAALTYLREQGLVNWEEERLPGKSYRAPRVYVELNPLGHVWVKTKILEPVKGLIPLIEQEVHKGEREFQKG
jgi:DNA-binding PadR family transcriptional regulator